MTAAHMVEHSALSVGVAPAIVLAWFALRLPRPPLGHPMVPWAAFVVAQWVFHLTPLLEESSDTAALHVFEHLAFLATGVWFWAPVLSWRRRGVEPRLGDPERSLYLFTASPAIDLVGAALIARGQVGAGVAMLAASFPIIAAAIAVTWQWLASEERQADSREGAHAPS